MLLLVLLSAGVLILVLLVHIDTRLYWYCVEHDPNTCELFAIRAL